MDRFHPDPMDGLRLVKDALGGPRGGQRVLPGRDRMDRDPPGQKALVQRLLLNRAGKVVPTCHSGIAPVEDARELVPEGRLPQETRERKCGSRCAQLVVDHPQFRALVEEPQNGTEEIVSPGGIDPAGADDEGMVRSERPDTGFTLGLAGTVTVHGRNGVFRPPRSPGNTKSVERWIRRMFQAWARRASSLGASALTAWATRGSASARSTVV